MEVKKGQYFGAGARRTAFCVIFHSYDLMIYVLERMEFYYFVSICFLDFCIWEQYVCSAGVVFVRRKQGKHFIIST